MLENLRQELDRILNEHQHESGGGEKLGSRLLALLNLAMSLPTEPGRVDQEN